MVAQIVIEARFNGPNESGNGGYTAGLVATAMGADHTGAEVTLRQPPPLDTSLSMVTTGGQVSVYAADTLIAEAAPAVLDEETVPPVSYAEAVAAAAAYPGFAEHPFPACYVCGPQRGDGDGLRIFPGPRPHGHTAAPWQVPAGATTATVWAALDCPGGWAIIAAGRPYILGRIAARVRRVPTPDSACVVTGAVGEVQGRKAHVRTALYGPDGELLAHARATWIAIDQS